MGFYKKKPVKIEARQWLGDVESALDLVAWADQYNNDIEINSAGILTVHTLEGRMHAWPGYWLVRGAHNEFYAVAPDIFAETYVQA